jgi:nucleotide-binding universal stress UspA family protein
MSNTILVPLDGSTLAEQSLPCAQALARAGGSRLVLLSAIAPTETWLEAAGVYTPDRHLQEEADAAKRYLDSVSARLPSDLVAVAEVAWGKAAEVISEAAEKHDSPLIVMTSHGRSGIPRMVMGSVANEVLRTATQPVLVVRASEEARQDCPLSPIVVALDGSSFSEQALPYAEDLAARLDAEIVLVRAVEPPAAIYAAEAIPSAAPYLAEVEEEAKRYVRKHAYALAEKGLRTRFASHTGYPADAIVDVSKDVGAGLLVLTTHARAGIARWMLGSTTDAVLRNAPCPCLVIRAGQVEAPAQTQYETTVPQIEIVEGVSVAPLVIPQADIQERELPGRPQDHAPPARTHRPERRILQ